MSLLSHKKEREMDYLALALEVAPLAKKHAEAEFDQTEVWDFHRIIRPNGEEWMEGTRLDKPGTKRWKIEKHGQKTKGGLTRTSV